MCPVCARKLSITAFSPKLVHRVFLQYYTEMKVNFLLWIDLMRKMLGKDNRGVWIKSNLCLSLILSIRTSSTYLHWGQSLFSLLAQVDILPVKSQFVHTENVPKMGGLLWLHLQTQEGQHSMESSLALFPTSFLGFMHCIFLGKLDRRGCRAFPSFYGYFTLGDGLRSRPSPAHHLAAKQETCWKIQGGFCRGDFTIQTF